MESLPPKQNLNWKKEETLLSNERLDSPPPF